MDQKLKTKNSQPGVLSIRTLVGEEGLGPSRLIQPADFKSAAYTNSATRPYDELWRHRPECRYFVRNKIALPCDARYGKASFTVPALLVHDPVTGSMHISARRACPMQHGSCSPGGTDRN